MLLAVCSLRCTGSSKDTRQSNLMHTHEGRTNHQQASKKILLDCSAKSLAHDRLLTPLVFAITSSLTQVILRADGRLPCFCRTNVERPEAGMAIVLTIGLSR